MNSKKLARKAFTGIFAGGATVSVGFLSFAGMFVISPGLGFCITALVLAVAFEGQIYSEGISSALRRMFDQNHLKKAIADREIKLLLKEYHAKLKNNPQSEANHSVDRLNWYLAVYQEQQAYIKALEHNHNPTADLEAKKEAAEEQLEELKSLYIQQLNNNSPKRTPKQKEIEKLFNNVNKEKLRSEIYRKSWLIRCSWIFAIAGGISSGLAAFSAIQEGIVTLAAVSSIAAAIPAGVLLSLAVFAAFGYTFMLYQTMSDAIQKYNGKWQEYCNRREHEGLMLYSLRMVGIVAVVSLGVFATIATAGTWWKATRDGALLLKFGETTARVIRNISVPLMAVATIVFNVSNSMLTIDKISASDYPGAFRKALANIRSNKETFLQFINPFRFLAMAIDGTINGLLFIGHIISMGFIGDRLDPLPPQLTAALIAVNEATVDLQYLKKENEEAEHHHHEDNLHHEHSHSHSHGHAHEMGLAHQHGHQHGHGHSHEASHDDEEGHNHSHDSVIKSVLLAPFKVVVLGLSGLAVLWDAPFSGFNKAYVKFFPKDNHTWSEPEAPLLIKNWVSSNAQISQNMGGAIITARKDGQINGSSASQPASNTSSGCMAHRFHQQKHAHGTVVANARKLDEPSEKINFKAS